MNKMKGYRAMLGKSQEEMAKELGVALNTYRAWEDNPKKMKVTAAMKFLELVKEKDSSVEFSDIFLQ